MRGAFCYLKIHEQMDAEGKTLKKLIRLFLIFPKNDILGYTNSPGRDIARVKKSTHSNPDYFKVISEA